MNLTSCVCSKYKLFQQFTDVRRKNVITSNTNEATDVSVRFGAFVLAGPAGPLTRRGSNVALRPKAMALLWALACRSGAPVSKDELFAIGWPDQVPTDGNLAVCVREIRQALGDDQRSPGFLQTVHRYGYRFLTPSSASGAEDDRFVFVGRDAELDALNAALAETQASGPRLILISGAAGLGKTVLIDAWRRALGGEPNIQVALGRCGYQGGAADAYGPFIAALRQICDRDNKALKLARRVAPHWAPLLRSPLLDQKDSAGLTTAPVDADGMRRELCDLFHALSASSQTVIILEDMHWSDPSSAAALGSIMRAGAAMNLLIVISVRSAIAPGVNHPLGPLLGELKVAKLCVEIPLSPLTKQDVADYAKARFDQDASAHFAGALWQRTSGHPLFLSALADHMAKTGAALTAEAVLESSAPADLVTFISIRVDELAAAERRVIDAASIAGPEFYTAEIEEAAGLGPGVEVDEVCEGLAARGAFLAEVGVEAWPDGALTGHYRFRHALYPELIRGLIGASRRARMHRMIGERLERGYGDAASTIAARLARHFEEAQDAAHAVSYLLTAAATAEGRQAHVEAAALLRHGLTLAEKLHDKENRAQLELQLLLALGPALVAMEGYAAPAVEETFARARALCRAPSLAEMRPPVLRGLAGFHILRGRHRVAHELGEELTAFSSHDAFENDGPQLEGALMRGVADYFRGRFPAADGALQEAAARYDPARHADYAIRHGLDPVINTFSLGALIDWIRGEPDDALRKAEAALAHAATLDHPFTICQCHAYIAFLHQLREDDAETRRQSTLAANLARDHGFPYLTASERARQGWLRVRSGDIEDGIADIRAGAALYEDTGAVGGLTAILGTLAEAHLINGAYSSGLRALERPMALARENEEGFFLPELLRLKGALIWGARGPNAGETAERHLIAAIKLAQEQGADAWEVRAVVTLADLHHAQGRANEAQSLITTLKAPLSTYAPSHRLAGKKMPAHRKI